MGYNKEWKLNLKGTGLNKSDVVNNETLSKFLMLPKVRDWNNFRKKETKKLQRQRYLFGYFNNMLVDQCFEVFNMRVNRYVTSLSRFCSESIEQKGEVSSLFNSVLGDNDAQESVDQPRWGILGCWWESQNLGKGFKFLSCRPWIQHLLESFFSAVVN